ncbi:hypothetical protein PSEUDO9AZ_20401 [Pseudomonas sp. 9AZ]|nr:hypothetical protein PSEUDO9AZ_20401 [Pseudomonas sp. 9AZ]
MRSSRPPTFIMSVYSKTTTKCCNYTEENNLLLAACQTWVNVLPRNSPLWISAYAQPAHLAATYQLPAFTAHIAWRLRLPESEPPARTRADRKP